MSNRYAGQVSGHQVELEFDRQLVVLNQARLFVDGERQDETKVFYGEKELRADLPDGTAVVVTFGSGGVGELQRPQLRTAEDSWVDMERLPTG